MFERRVLFPALTGLGTTVASLFGSKAVKASPQAGFAPGFLGDVEPRGTDRRLERLPILDLESQQDFLTGFRIWTQRGFRPLAPKRMDALFDAKGLDAKSDPSLETVLELADNDKVLGMQARTWISCQQLTWKTIQEYVHANADTYGRNGSHGPHRPRHA